MKFMDYFPKETVKDKLVVLVYEVGDLAKALHRLDRYQGERDKAIYTAETRVSLGDILSMTHQLIETLGYDPQVILEEAQERFKERVDDIDKYGSV